MPGVGRWWKYDKGTGAGVLLWRKYMATMHYIRVGGGSWEEDKMIVIGCQGKPLRNKGLSIGKGMHNGSGKEYTNVRGN